MPKLDHRPSPRDAAQTSDLPRRSLLALALSLAVAAPLAAAAAPVRVEVWKEPSCSCCGDWIKHLQANGFQVKVNETGTSGARARFGIAPKYASCHTAVVEGYALEGHVPAREVKRLLRERPQALGLAVPGMHIGSPGMDTPAYGGRRDPYSVLLLRKDGSDVVYQDYR